MSFLYNPFLIGIMIKCGFTMLVFYAAVVLLTPNSKLPKLLNVIKKIGMVGLVMILVAFLLLVLSESDNVIRLIRNLLH